MGNRENRGKKELQALEAVCRVRLHTLESWMHLEDVADVRALCDVIEAYTGRQIHLEPWHLTADVAGFWLASDTTDYIFYAQDATPPHQEHIILHELAHILSGHAHTPIDVQMLQNIYFPHLSHDVVHLALSRSCYDTTAEREAEVLASLIEQHWRMARFGAGSPTAVGDDASALTDADVQRVREHLDDFVAKLQDS